MTKKIYSILLLAIVASVLYGRICTADVLTFEDFGPGSNPILAGYGGFNWDSKWQIGVLEVTSPSAPFFLNSAHSGTHVAFNWEGRPICSIDWIGTDTFYFNGAFLTRGYDGLTITVFAYNNGVNVYQKNIDSIISSSQPTWVTFDWKDIDQLVIYSQLESNPALQDTLFWAMDDFTFNESNPNNPVPLPPTLLLLGSGLVGVLGLRKTLKR